MEWLKKKYPPSSAVDVTVGNELLAIVAFPVTVAYDYLQLLPQLLFLLMGCCRGVGQTPLDPRSTCPM
jgi:hypothetical protein